MHMPDTYAYRHICLIDIDTCAWRYRYMCLGTNLEALLLLHVHICLVDIDTYAYRYICLVDIDTCAREL
jgi:hypothetical protein